MPPFTNNPALLGGLLDEILLRVAVESILIHRILVTECR